jgi:hypothetical protein
MTLSIASRFSRTLSGLGVLGVWPFFPGPSRYLQPTLVLVAGSGLRFVDRGAHDLRGVPEQWRLFAVEAARTR